MRRSSQSANYLSNYRSATASMPVSAQASKNFVSTSSAMTRDIGRQFGATLTQGDCVFMFGEIGAGKTVFVNGIAEALGIIGPLQSPTFTISNIHRGNATLHHFDAYRISSVDELRDTGFYECLECDGIVVLEWAQRLPEDALPDTRIDVWIEQCVNERQWLDGALPMDEGYNENRRSIRIIHYNASVCN